MDQRTRNRRGGEIAFFFSGFCTLGNGVIVSLLEEQFGFNNEVTGTMLSLLSIGNLVAGLLTGFLPGVFGTRATILLLSSGFLLGYGAAGLTGAVLILSVAFFLIGLSKGCALNSCSVLVGNNADDRTKALNLNNAVYALGGLLSPIVLSLAMGIGPKVPMFVMSAFGACMLLAFAWIGLPRKSETRKQNAAGRTKEGDFLHNKKFWMLTGLLFCQVGAENSVNGWLVTYYKKSGILPASISPYTITIMWTATLVARLLLAFVIPIKDRFKTLAVMGVFSTIFYVALVMSNQGVIAMVLLFCFAFSMAGVHGTAVAGAGSMTSAKSLGIMLPIGGIGAIVMPWIIGVVGERVNLQMGMMTNAILCAGIIVFSILCGRAEKAEANVE